jgi:ornithine carbamoyltransferase
MNFISMLDLGKEEIIDLLDTATILKKKKVIDRFIEGEPLRNRILALLFEKPSTRTRVSFEVATTSLGGHPIYLSWNDLQLSWGEPIADTAIVLSRYVDGVVIRANKHETVCEFAKHATIPTINGLSNLEHPCQSLADLMTIMELKGEFPGLKFAWVGDGNNVCNSSILACALTGMEISVACPEGYEPSSEIVAKARDIGCDVEITNDPSRTAEDADILYTDVWVSMGDESEKERRMRDFKGFRIDDELVEKANDDAIIMHCMPVHREEEITEGVINDPKVVMFEQAENKLHVQKALLSKLFGV